MKPQFWGTPYLERITSGCPFISDLLGWSKTKSYSPSQALEVRWSKYSNPSIRATCILQWLAVSFFLFLNIFLIFIPFRYRRSLLDATEELLGDLWHLRIQVLATGPSESELPRFNGGHRWSPLVTGPAAWWSLSYPHPTPQRAQQLGLELKWISVETHRNFKAFHGSSNVRATHFPSATCYANGSCTVHELTFRHASDLASLEVSFWSSHWVLQSEMVYPLVNVYKKLLKMAIYSGFTH